MEVAKRDPIDLEYTTVFGVAGLAPLGSGYALVLITAGERVLPQHFPHHQVAEPRAKHC